MVPTTSMVIPAIPATASPTAPWVAYAGIVDPTDDLTLSFACRSTITDGDTITRFGRTPDTPSTVAAHEIRSAIGSASSWLSHGSVGGVVTVRDGSRPDS